MRRMLLLCVAVLLSACGGGGGDGGSGPAQPTRNSSPTVNAGADQTAIGGNLVALTGTAQDSDGTIASVQWTQSSGATVSIQNHDTSSASFTAPVDVVNSDLEFQFSATDNDGASSSDVIRVSVSAAVVPIVDAGMDISPYRISTYDCFFNIASPLRFCMPAIGLITHRSAPGLPKCNDIRRFSAN